MGEVMNGKTNRMIDGVMDVMIGNMTNRKNGWIF